MFFCCPDPKEERVDWFSAKKVVFNLREKVIPVMDLRLRFGMETTDYTERTCIIVSR